MKPKKARKSNTKQVERRSHKMAKENMVWVYVLLIAAVLLTGTTWMAVNSLNVPESVPATVDNEAIIGGVVNAIAPLIPTTTASENESTNTVVDNSDVVRIITEEERAEAYALGLFEDELTDRDLKEFLQERINKQLEEAGFNVEVESWRDIDSISITDSDVDVDGDEATVEAEVKVYFFLDGDEDEEDLERAKFTITLEVEDLDDDDNFEDAEIVDYDSKNFEFNRFYGDLF